MNPVSVLLVIAHILAGFAIGIWVSLYLVLPFLGAAVVIALTLKAANVWPKQNHRRSSQYFIH